MKGSVMILKEKSIKLFWSWFALQLISVVLLFIFYFFGIVRYVNGAFYVSFAAIFLLLIPGCLFTVWAIFVLINFIATRNLLIKEEYKNYEKSDIDTSERLYPKASGMVFKDDNDDDSKYTNPSNSNVTNNNSDNAKNDAVASFVAVAIAIVFIIISIVLISRC